MSARKMLNKGGEIHITHRDDYPYNRWNVKNIAEACGLVLKKKVEFRKRDYPGYHNKKGYGTKSNKQFPINQGFTFIFTIDERNYHRPTHHHQVPYNYDSGAYHQERKSYRRYFSMKQEFTFQEDKIHTYYHQVPSDHHVDQDIKSNGDHDHDEHGLIGVVFASMFWVLILYYILTKI